jgi:amidase
LAFDKVASAASSATRIGVQIIGGDLEDLTTIAFAGMIEREFGGFAPPPLD